MPKRDMPEFNNVKKNLHEAKSMCGDAATLDLGQEHPFYFHISMQCRICLHKARYNEAGPCKILPVIYVTGTWLTLKWTIIIQFRSIIAFV